MKHTIKILNAGFFAVLLLSLSACHTEKKEVTAPAQETSENKCITGGPGKSHCSIEPGIDIGGTFTVGCSVTCEEGYYACCGARCVCVPES